MNQKNIAATQLLNKSDKLFILIMIIARFFEKQAV